MAFEGLRSKVKVRGDPGGVGVTQGDCPARVRGAGSPEDEVGSAPARVDTEAEDRQEDRGEQAEHRRPGGPSATQRHRATLTGGGRRGCTSGAGSGPVRWRNYRGPVRKAPVPERFRPLVEATTDLAGRFAAADRALYLVGGSVRDALVAQAPPPEGARAGAPGARTGAQRRCRASLRPTTTSPPTPGPDEIEQIVGGWADAVWTQGKRFGTIGCRTGGRSTRSPPTGPRSTGPTPASPR